MLWAWERAENLQFISPEKTGVAYLAKTIFLQADKVVSRPRLQPLRIPPGVMVIPTVRIETSLRQPPRLSQQQLEKTVEIIAGLANHESSFTPGNEIPSWRGKGGNFTIGAHQNQQAIQIDFDAKTTERAFYRQLLGTLRQRLPQSYFISMTALASWCLMDNWIQDLPVDEAVPMLYDLGTEQSRIQTYLQTHPDFPAPICRHSIGVSTADPTWAKRFLGKRIYWFNPHGSWSNMNVNKVKGPHALR